jgi:AbiV family abortive infection protein
MTDESKSETVEHQTSSHWRQRQLCLDHARDLIASAERLLPDDGGYPNIAYHLAILAMEEIGKAGMLGARAVVNGALDSGWMDKRLDNQLWKLMWGVWSPSLSGKIDPKAFEEARRFAESTHARRMAGLYVDYSEDSVLAPPREAVRREHATSLVGLAKASLELETAKVAPVGDEGREELDWFLATVNNEIGSQRLFSKPYIKMYEEFGGDTRAWVRWARGEFQRVAEQEKAHLQRELSRQASKRGEGKPKWLMKVRLQTPSHSIRQKTLNYWNERINSVKLQAVGNRSNDVLLEMTINDHVTVEQLFDFGLSFSKMHIIMLNIATCGFFWYELSGQAETYYESIKDLEAPHMKVAIGRLTGLPREWMQPGPDGQRRERVALQEEHLNIAIMAMMAFGFMPDEEAGPIFGPYLQALTLLSKTDLHLGVANQARDGFMTALRRAMVKFGDLKSETDDLLPALHRVMEPIIPDEGHRNQIFLPLQAELTGSAADAINAKRGADLYLGLTARKLWPDLAKRASERPNSTLPEEPAPKQPGADGSGH